MDTLTDRPIGAEADAVARAMQRIYDESLNGDVEAVKRLMHAEVTLWDSEVPTLAHGVAHLQQLRGRTPLEQPDTMPLALELSDPFVTVRGSIAVLRHILTVRFEDRSVASIRIRNTSVWELCGDEWMMLHNHEDVRESDSPVSAANT